MSLCSSRLLGSRLASDKRTMMNEESSRSKRCTEKVITALDNLIVLQFLRSAFRSSVCSIDENKFILGAEQSDVGSFDASTT